MLCPNCRQEIEAGSKFCGNCGAHIESHLVGLTCPECGSPLLPGAEFCTECGARVGGEPNPVYAFCPECGTAVMPGDTFCVACGARLTEAVVPPTENRQSFQTQDREYSSQQDWAQPQAQPQLQGREPVQIQQQGQPPQQPQKPNQRKMLMAAAAAVVLLVIGITGFWKPGFLLDFFRPTAKLENGTLALNDITLDFKQTNLKNGEATLTTVKDGRAVAVIDPAALGRSQRKSKAAAKPAVKTPDVGQFTEYVGVFFKNGIIQYGEGYQNTKGHFRLWYNYNVQRYKNVYMAGGDAQNLLSDLEEAYNYYKTHGYADHVDTYVPIDVYITRCKDEGGWQTLTGNMELKEASIFGVDLNQGYEGDNRKNTRTTIYHEFFHAVQQSIIGTAASASDSKNSNWFDEATATHFERVIVPDAVSENGRKNFWLLWQGTIPQKSGTADGYARGLLIDYMSKKLGGNDWIRDCYNRWSADYSKLKSYMKQIAATDADFAANFYMEVVKNSGPQSVSGYYVTSQIPNKSMGEDTYLSAINLALDDKAKEKLSNGEEDAFPIVFTSPSFVLEGYGGHVISLVSHKRVGATVENLTENFPEKCQLKLEADGGCRIQVIKFKGNADVKFINIWCW